MRLKVCTLYVKKAIIVGIEEVKDPLWGHWKRVSALQMKAKPSPESWAPTSIQASNAPGTIKNMPLNENYIEYQVHNI